MAVLTDDDSPDSPIVLDGIHIALRDMFRKGQIDEHTYFKGLVGLACRWMVLGKREDALSLVCELSKEYITIGMPFQMAGDETFRTVAYGLARALSRDLPDMDDEDVKIALMLTEKPVAKA